jgi:hypothetical protein
MSDRDRISGLPAGGMSIERVRRKSGVVWRVRWRENGQPRSRVMGSKRDAELFEADITRRKRLGQLAQIDAGRQTVAEFAREWWRIHAEPNGCIAQRADPTTSVVTRGAMRRRLELSARQ